MWIALGGYAAERNHGYITGLLLLGWLSNIPPALLDLGPSSDSVLYYTRARVKY